MINPFAAFSFSVLKFFSSGLFPMFDVGAWICIVAVEVSIFSFHVYFKMNLLILTGVQIVDICLATRTHNGGLISSEDLCKILGQRRKGGREAVSEDDCLRAISKLKLLWL